MKKWLAPLALLFAILLSAPAATQWQVPDHAVPIGNGAGVTGFNAVGPCTSGYFIGGTGASTDPTCQGFLQSGTGATTRTWQDKVRETVSVKDFGATGDGTTDDTTAIQNAINALPVTGGDVMFSAGNYKVTSTISVGNGSGSAVTTRYGVRLIGVGYPVPGLFANYPDTSNVRIFWGGAAAGGPVVKIAGPLQGWGIENLSIDCASSANRGLNVVSGQYGWSRNLQITNCKTWGLYSETVAHFTGVTVTDSLNNRYDGLTIVVPSGAVGGGIILTGQTDSNTDFNVFTRTVVAILGNTQNGIYLQAACGNVFLGTQITGQVGITNVVFDYNVNNTWPCNNTFDTIEPAPSTTFMSNSGSPGGGAKPNYLRNLITTDGATYPTLANLLTDVVPVPVANGGTNCTVASGTCLDNITGFSATGFAKRTGAGAYSFIADPLPVANGGTGDTGTAWTTFTPSPACGTATFTVNSAKSKTLGKTTFIEGDFTITAIGTCASPNITFTLPNTPNSTGVTGGRDANTGKGAYCVVLSASTTATCVKSDVSAWLVNQQIQFSGVYENQ